MCLFVLLGVAGLGAIAPVVAEDAELVEIHFEGLDEALIEPVQNSLTIYQQHSHDRLNSARIEILHRRATGEIDAALQALGYYGSTIHSTLIEDDGHWLASYAVALGDRVHVDDTAISLRGAGEFDTVLHQAVAAFPLRPGDPLLHAEYESGKRQLSRKLAEQGYFDARIVRNEIRVDRSAKLARIVIDVETGQRYRLGPVEFIDNPLEPGFVQSYVPFSAGEPYSAATLLQLRDRLVGSNYFGDAVVDPDIDRGRADDGREVPVTVRLTPRMRQRYSIGAGFGTDTGPRGRLGWEHRYLNDSGHHLKTELSASAIRSGLGASYSIPFGDPVTDRWVFSASIRDEDTDSRENRTLSFSAGRSTLRWGWDELASLTYQLEDFKPGEERSRTSVLLYPGLRWSRLWADNPVYTHHGARLEIDLRGAAEEVASDVSFLQLRVTGKYILGLGEHNRFIFRGQFGTTGVSDFGDFPTSLRFFAGGDNSVRGFDFEELGPRDEDNDNVGGKHLVVGSVEYEHRVFGNWSVAAFTDFGNAYDDFSEDLAYSVGAGLRWLSPIGPVRLDLAVPISESDSSFRLHINIGPDL
jgi:translocation and assembly module TamA